MLWGGDRTVTLDLYRHEVGSLCNVTCSRHRTWSCHCGLSYKVSGQSVCGMRTVGIVVYFGPALQSLLSHPLQIGVSDMRMDAFKTSCRNMAQNCPILLMLGSQVLHAAVSCNLPTTCDLVDTQAAILRLSVPPVFLRNALCVSTACRCVYWWMFCSSSDLRCWPGVVLPPPRF